MAYVFEIPKWELPGVVMKIISSFHLTAPVSSFCFGLARLVSVSAHSSLCVLSFIRLLASAQRPEEVIQRYMEVVAGVPDEVNVS